MGENMITETGESRSAEALWDSALSKLRDRIPAPYYASMISPLRILSADSDSCSLGAPNGFAKDVVEKRYRDEIVGALSEVLGRNVTVHFTVSGAFRDGSGESGARQQAEAEPGSNPNTGQVNHFQPPPQNKYTFDNFIVGDSNRFAYSAALMVAEFPGHKYNPLFIHGGTGLGKTHLLYAIQGYAKTMSPSIKVTYVHTSKFIDEFIATVTFKRDKAVFDQKYLNNKIVLFDDIQALSGTEGTQNKFFDLFNLLYSASSHIVLSSDRPPSEIPQLSKRIRSRFEGGLMIDIKPPDLETRMAILRMKSDAENVSIPDDALIYMASKVKDNIRSLEGLLHRVVAYAKLYGTEIDLPMVQEVLQDQVSEEKRNRTPSVLQIQEIVSRYYNVPVSDLTSKSRSRPLVQSRQIAMYLCRELTGETLVRIGGKFGGRDHATVIHSCNKVESMIKLKREIFHEVTELTNIISNAV